MKQLRFSGMSKLTPGCPGICSSGSQGALGINGLRALMVLGHQEAENESLYIRQGILQEPGSPWRDVYMCKLDPPCLGFG